LIEVLDLHILIFYHKQNGHFTDKNNKIYSSLSCFASLIVAS
jgi:hypothetical protein